VKAKVKNVKGQPQTLSLFQGDIHLTILVLKDAEEAIEALLFDLCLHG